MHRAHLAAVHLKATVHRLLWRRVHLGMHIQVRIRELAGASGTCAALGLDDDNDPRIQAYYIKGACVVTGMCIWAHVSAQERLRGHGMYT